MRLLPSLLILMQDLKSVACTLNLHVCNCWLPLATLLRGMPIYDNELWAEWIVKLAKQTAAGTTSSMPTLIIAKRLHLAQQLEGVKVWSLFVIVMAVVVEARMLPCVHKTHLLFCWATAIAPFARSRGGCLP